MKRDRYILCVQVEVLVEDFKIVLHKLPQLYGEYRGVSVVRSAYEFVERKYTCLGETRDLAWSWLL